MKKKILFIVINIILLSQYGYAASMIYNLSLSEEYNDNIMLDNDENKISDWITIVSPGVLLEASAKKIGMTIDYNFAHSSYQTYSENDSFRHNAAINSWLKLSRHTELSLNNRFIQTEEMETGETFTGVRNDRKLYYTNSVSANVDHTFGSNKTINIKYLYSLLENEDKQIEDNEGHKGFLSLRYSFAPHIVLEADTSYEKGEYDISPGFVRLESRTRFGKIFSSTFDVFIEYTHTDFNNDAEQHMGDYRIYNPSAGTNIAFGDGGIFSINAGYFIQERDHYENESGLSFDGNLGKHWRFKRGLISITGISGYEDSQMGSENLGFNIFYQVNFAAEYAFTKNIKSKLGAFRRYSDYISTVSGQPDRNDENYNLDVAISWQAKKWFNANLLYRYQQRDSNVDINDYVENSIILSLSLKMDK